MSGGEPGPLGVVEVDVVDLDDGLGDTYLTYVAGVVAQLVDDPLVALVTID